LGALAALLPAAPTATAAGEGEPPELTPFEDVVMYAIDADTYELLRYTFDSDLLIRIGVVIDQNGVVVTDVEGLALIPSGPYKGVYGTANYYEDQPSKLVRISAFDASGWVYPADIGHEDKVEGLVSVRNPLTGDWSLLAAHKQPDPGLIKIDPATGAGTPIRQTSQRYQGLAISSTGKLYASTQDPAELWEIDLSRDEDNDETLIGQMSDYTKCEALEWAFGDNEPRIKVPEEGHDVVPDSWTMNGILFGFDDDADAFLIINADDGDAIRYECAFQTIDCEGLVFTTRTRDTYGAVLADGCD
jgi:hypothetical protein